jgi:hypothetical protein
MRFVGRMRGNVISRCCEVRNIDLSRKKKSHKFLGSSFQAGRLQMAPMPALLDHVRLLLQYGIDVFVLFGTSVALTSANLLSV